MDVDTGDGVGTLCHHAGYQGHTGFIQGVGHTVVQHHGDGGVATHYLHGRGGSGVVVAHGLHVGVEERLYGGQLTDKPLRHGFGALCRFLGVFGGGGAQTGLYQRAGEGGHSL